MALNRSLFSGGYDRFSVVGFLGLLFVDQGVVVAAEENQVVENCFASVSPEDNVVDVAPPC